MSSRRPLLLRRDQSAPPSTTATQVPAAWQLLQHGVAEAGVVAAQPHGAVAGAKQHRCPRSCKICPEKLQPVLQWITTLFLGRRHSRGAAEDGGECGVLSTGSRRGSRGATDRDKSALGEEVGEGKR